MTAPAARTFTTDDLHTLLVSVGLDRRLGPEAFTKSFADLDLDSLARVEIASRIKTRFRLDVEDRVTAASTPAELVDLVNEHADRQAGVL